MIKTICFKTAHESSIKSSGEIDHFFDLDFIPKIESILEKVSVLCTNNDLIGDYNSGGGTILTPNSKVGCALVCGVNVYKWVGWFCQENGIYTRGWGLLLYHEFKIFRQLNGVMTTKMKFAPIDVSPLYELVKSEGLNLIIWRRNRKYESLRKK
ncbi:MAG TPA: hypothetical protein ENI23_13630 [bacterium]|nr:hypothetical protein [bacterium]